MVVSLLYIAIFLLIQNSPLALRGQFSYLRKYMHIRKVIFILRNVDHMFCLLRIFTLVFVCIVIVTQYCILFANVTLSTLGILK